LIKSVRFYAIPALSIGKMAKNPFWVFAYFQASSTICTFAGLFHHQKVEAVLLFPFFAKYKRANFG
jgi:hypothetical protein